MGYYTEHELDIVGEGRSNLGQYEDEIINHIGFNPFEEATKWYDYSKDMIYISQKYPDIIFEITGCGENSEDIWRHYFKNGKSQHVKAKITFDEYNPDKLS